jgi:cobalt/nickel transport system permease protein
MPSPSLLINLSLLHIPDGMLSLPVSLIFWVATILLIVIASRRTARELGDRQIPLMGVMAAFIFAAQMINFPIGGGTSGHLLGGVLAAVMLGPWAAILVMTSVIAVQALLFQDGGLLVLGANIFNMGFLTVLVGYGFYRVVAGMSRNLRLAVVGVAAWLSVMASALLAALQLWLSGTALLAIVVPAMLGVHAFIGLGEALISVAALSFIMRTRPGMIEAHRTPEKSAFGWVAGGLLASGFVVLLSPLASTNPDGFERVAMQLGFMDLGTAAPYEFFPDYTIPILGETAISTILAGLVGVTVVVGLTVYIIRILRRRLVEV